MSFNCSTLLPALVNFMTFCCYSWISNRVTEVQPLPAVSQEGWQCPLMPGSELPARPELSCCLPSSFSRPFLCREQLCFCQGMSSPLRDTGTATLRPVSIRIIWQSISSLSQATLLRAGLCRQCFQRRLLWEDNELHKEDSLRPRIFNLLDKAAGAHWILISRCWNQSCALPVTVWEPTQVKKCHFRAWFLNSWHCLAPWAAAMRCAAGRSAPCTVPQPHYSQTIPPLAVFKCVLSGQAPLTQQARSLWQTRFLCSIPPKVV